LIRPAPTPGLVVRYDYLWLDERRAGCVEGSKDRPCVIILALESGASGVQHVIVAPITHAMPTDASTAHEIASAVKAQLGLDDARSWIVASEINRVRWDDAGFVPVAPGRWAYGRIPSGLWKAVRDTIRSRASQAGLGIVERTS
jgi:PemK-like, MazF-like toxin of type II toxin-antitoxin system